MPQTVKIQLCHNVVAAATTTTTTASTTATTSNNSIITNRNKMVLHISSEPVSFWSPPPPCLMMSSSGPGSATSSAINANMRNKLRYRPASIKYSRRSKNGGITAVAGTGYGGGGGGGRGGGGGAIGARRGGGNGEGGGQVEKTHLPTAFGMKMNECLLSTVGDWDFNIFNLDKLTNGRSLFHITLHLFQEHNLIKTFQLDIVKLMRCITLIEEGYHSANPYHNAVHAADVVQAMHCYLQEERLAAALTPLERLTAIVSAITHDLDHPGVNQAFLIATSNHLAALYNNTSVLENHHWRSAVGVLRESGLLDHFDSATWARIEMQLRSLILATDITRQPEFLDRFKKHLNDDDLQLSEESHRLFLLQIALKCADISNPCRAWTASKRWSQQVCEEFFKQGDYERKLGLPVTPLCDKESTTVAKIQIGFMKFVVQPLFTEWQRFNTTPLSAQMLRNVRTNQKRWEAIEAGEEDKDDYIKALPATFKFTSSSTSSSRKSSSNHSSSKVKSEHAEIMSSANKDSEHSAGSGDSGKEAEEEEDEDIGSSPKSPGSPSLSPPSPPPRAPPRRHSMPKVQPLPGGPRTASSVHRRHSLPVVVALSVSLEKLSEKLAMIAECFPSNNGSGSSSKALVLDALRPNITQLSQSLDEHAMERGSEAGSTITSAHGLDKVVITTSSSSAPPPPPPVAVHPSPPMSHTASPVAGSPEPSEEAVPNMPGLRVPVAAPRRASEPYHKVAGDDTQPLLMTIQQSGELLARRHSDVPSCPTVVPQCYFPTCNSLLAVAAGGGGGGKGGGDTATTPLLLASHDSLPSLQV